MKITAIKKIRNENGRRVILGGGGVRVGRQIHISVFFSVFVAFNLKQSGTTRGARSTEHFQQNCLTNTT